MNNLSVIHFKTKTKNDCLLLTLHPDAKKCIFLKRKYRLNYQEELIIKSSERLHC